MKIEPRDVEKINLSGGGKLKALQRQNQPEIIISRRGNSSQDLFTMLWKYTGE